MAGGCAQPGQEADRCMWVQNHRVGLINWGRVGELVCLQHWRGDE